MTPIEDTGGSGKTSRITKLTDEQKANISNMATPKQMPYDERKRQYSALRRAITRSCEPALLAKFSLSTDGERWGVGENMANSKLRSTPIGLFVQIIDLSNMIKDQHSPYPHQDKDLP